MPPNDSDSSDEDNASFTTTNVLLGYASKEPTDYSFSQLGGYPTWLDDSSAPSVELAKCKICNSIMTLLLQLNGDLPEKFPQHERKLYIFGCKNKACRKKDGTVRAIRGIRISTAATGKQKPKDSASTPKQKAQENQVPQNLGNSLFNSTFAANNSNQNPFSTSTSSTPANPFAPSPSSASASPFSTLASKPPQFPSSDLPATFAQKASISSSPPPTSPPKTPWPPKSSLPKPYPSYFLDADYESLDSEPASFSKPKMTTDIDKADSSSKDDGNETFESTIDKTFQRFADQLAQNPEQVLRYEFGGTPLLYSKIDTVGKIFAVSAASSSGSTNAKVKTAASQAGSGIPRCTNCGAGRTFELQLVPHAIAELEIEEEGLDGMEWGTIILGVCEKDCGERGVQVGDVGWVEEWVGVQWEESGAIRKG